MIRRLRMWWLRGQIARMADDIERLGHERDNAALAIDYYQQALARTRGQLWALEWPNSVVRSAPMRRVDQRHAKGEIA